jgi:xylulokinase
MASTFVRKQVHPGFYEGIRITHVYPGSGRVELSAQEVTRAFRACVALAVGARDSREITAIAITSQAQTFTVYDTERRQARTPFYSWQDERAQPTCAAWQDTPLAAAVRGQTSFNTLLPGMQLALLLHLTRADGLRVTATDRLLPLPAYLVNVLNPDAYCTDTNLAAMSGLYSLPAASWWEEALAACRLTREQLPSLHAVGSIGAYTAAAACAYHLPPGIPVILAGNDQTAGAYGAGVHNHHGLLVTLGTALAACRPSPDGGLGHWIQ